MAYTYLVTGGTGHLGQAVVRAALARGERVRALVMPADRFAHTLPAQVERVQGDVTDAASLRPFFDLPGAKRVLHCAGRITVSTAPDARMRQVNVEGVRNMLALAREYGVERFVYVGSVHAIPEVADNAVMREPEAYDPALVVGQYAKSKAEAAALAQAAARQGLPAVLALPAGMLGPYDVLGGHMTRLFRALTHKGLRAVVRGGYNFADVRDVAQGLLACAQDGRAGESYILSGRYYTMLEMARLYCAFAGRGAVYAALPLWLGRAIAPVAERVALARGGSALFTPYTLHTLAAPALFSNEKARRELGYTVRPLDDTLRDMARWENERQSNQIE